MEGLQWWGYLHTNGTIQVKRYYVGYRRDCDESEFVVACTNPFSANSRADAMEIATEKLKSKRRLAPGTYKAEVSEVIIREDGSVDLDFLVEGTTLRFNIHKAE